MRGPRLIAQAADQHTFTVVGIANGVTRYKGVPTTIFHLAEIQQVSGTTPEDPITVSRWPPSRCRSTYSWRYLSDTHGVDALQNRPADSLA